MKIMIIILLAIIEIGLLAFIISRLPWFNRDGMYEREETTTEKHIKEIGYAVLKFDEMMRGYEDIHCERCRYFNTEMCDKCKNCVFYSPRYYMPDPKPPVAIHYIIS